MYIKTATLSLTVALLAAACSGPLPDEQDAAVTEPEPVGDGSASAVNDPSEGDPVNAVLASAQTLSEAPIDANELPEYVSDLAAKVGAIDDQLPADQAELVKEQMQSAVDAAETEDWAAVQQAAKSIVTTLKVAAE